MKNSPTLDLGLVNHIGQLSTMEVGRNLFAGKVRPASLAIPDQAAFVSVTGGDSPVPFFGESGDLVRPAVEVVVRSAKRDFDGGRSLAWSIHGHCHRAQVQKTLGISADQSAPVLLSEDDDGRFLWVINLTVTASEE